MISGIFPGTGAVDIFSHKEAQGAQEAVGEKQEDKRDWPQEGRRRKREGGLRLTVAPAVSRGPTMPQSRYLPAGTVTLTCCYLYHQLHLENTGAPLVMNSPPWPVGRTSTMGIGKGGIRQTWDANIASPRPCHLLAMWSSASPGCFSSVKWANR